MSQSDENTTTSTKVRWEYIGTLLATIIVASLVVLVGATAFGVSTLSMVPQGWFVLYSTLVLAAATWVFGPETIEKVRQLRGGSK